MFKLSLKTELWVLMAIAVTAGLFFGSISIANADTQEDQIYKSVSDISHDMSTRMKGWWDGDSMTRWVDHSELIAANDDHFVPDTCTHAATTIAMQIHKAKIPGVTSIKLYRGKANQPSATKVGHAVVVVNDSLVVDSLSLNWVRAKDIVFFSPLDHGFTPYEYVEVVDGLSEDELKRLRAAG